MEAKGGNCGRLLVFGSGDFGESLTNVGNRYTNVGKSGTIGDIFGDSLGTPP